MRQCISKIRNWFVNLWRTLVSTFVKKHKPKVYLQDVDSDDVPEIIIDVNGDKSKQAIDVEEEE